ncbi:hypothetical protein OBBRIDRAFT_705594, partial [Obba rivulosa]
MAAAARTSSPPRHDRDDPQRLSIVSTSASYLTAPQTAADSATSSRNSSAHTLGRVGSNDPETVNTLHALTLGHAHKGSTQEVHIVKVTEDALCLDVGKSFMHTVPAGAQN